MTTEIKLVQCIEMYQHTFANPFTTQINQCIVTFRKSDNPHIHQDLIIHTITTICSSTHESCVSHSITQSLEDQLALFGVRDALVAELLLTGACKYNNMETVGCVSYGREFNISQDL